LQLRAIDLGETTRLIRPSALAAISALISPSSPAASTCAARRISFADKILQQQLSALAAARLAHVPLLAGDPSVSLPTPTAPHTFTCLEIQGLWRHHDQATFLLGYAAQAARAALPSARFITPELGTAESLAQRLTHSAPARHGISEFSTSESVACALGTPPCAIRPAPPELAHLARRRRQCRMARFMLQPRAAQRSSLAGLIETGRGNLTTTMRLLRWASALLLRARCIWSFQMTMSLMLDVIDIPRH
jgi:hypothetical protein